MNHFIEIRSLNLKPNSREEFHHLYIKEALPLLQRWNFDVVAHGPSLHDKNPYYVIRRYDSLSQRKPDVLAVGRCERVARAFEEEDGKGLITAIYNLELYHN